MIKRPEQQPKLDPSYFGLFYGMGSGISKDDNPYALTWRLPSVTADFAKKYEEDGAKVCVRHRPFGETPGGPMDWDQAVTVKNDEEWSWLIEQYHTETTKLIERCPEAIIIDYLGTIEDQLEFRRKNGMYSQLIHRLWGGCQPCMNHKVWLGLDASSGDRYPDGSIYHHFMEVVAACKREQGCDVVVEALPKLQANPPASDYPGSEWSRNQHALCLERFYQERVNKLPDTFRYTSDTKITFRVANGHSRAAWDEMKASGIDPIEDWTSSCFENGHTPVWAMPGYDYKTFVSKWKSV